MWKIKNEKNTPIQTTLIIDWCKSDFNFKNTLCSMNTMNYTMNTLCTFGDLLKLSLKKISVSLDSFVGSLCLKRLAQITHYG